MSKKLTGSQPLPESGERVIVAPARSVLRKPPKPLTNDERNQIRRADRRRKAWEATPEGQARTTGIDTTRGANLAQIYHMDNYDVPEDRGPRVYDRQLPGMADPHAAPRPPKWEELDDNQRAHAERALRMRGTSIDQMAKDIGAQIDQAHMRASKFGEAEPYASRFYETGEPRKVVDTSADALGIPRPIHAMMNAFTSPNTKFSQHRADGSVSYPNDEAAMHSVRWAQSGRDPHEITNDMTTTGTGPKRAQGYVTNMRKAASAMSQFQQGVEPADWRFGPRGDKDAFSGSPKTGPYANSWNDTHPQFTVADVHTGGGGAFPHLSPDKPILYNADGTPKMAKTGEGMREKEKRDKSERELAIDRTPYAHSAVDYAMRQAMAERNLGSVRRSQATQWGEEQLQRGEAGLRGAPKEAIAYRRKNSQFEQLPGQGEMFEELPNGALTARIEASSRDPRSAAAKKFGTPF